MKRAWTARVRGQHSESKLRTHAIGKGLYRWYAGLCASLLVGSFIALAIDRFPQVAELLPLLVLLVAAEQRDRLFGDETSISGSIVIVMAAVVAFHGQDALAGPMLCGAMAGFYWPHLRDRIFSKVAINAFSMGGAAILAALTFRLVVGERVVSIGALLTAAIPTACVFWLVNSTVLAVAVVLLRGEPFSRTWSVLIRSETEMLLFALGGAGCGYLMATVSPIVGLLGLVLLLIAVDVLVIRRPRVRIRVGQSARRVRSAIQIALGLAAVSTVVALLFLEAFPEAVPLAVLAGTGATVTAIGRRLPLARRLSCSAVASLAAVGAFYDSSLFLGSGLLMGGVH